MTNALLDTRSINQIALVVHDIEEARESFALLFGVPKPAVFYTGSSELTKILYKGKATNSESKLCFINTGSVQIELIEPNEEPGTTREFLEKRGEGIHHIAFDVENLEAGIQALENMGSTVEESSQFSSGKGRRACMNTWHPYKIVLELLERENKYIPTEQQDGNRDQQPLLGTDKIAQIAIVVHDLQATADAYCKLLGVDKPDVVYPGAAGDTCVEYRSQKTEAGATFMFLDTPLIQIELIEPDEAPSIWRDHLEMLGEGIHHISFVVDNLDEKIALLEKRGYPVIQRGNFYNRKGRYAYMDTISTYKVVIELLEKVDS